MFRFKSPRGIARATWLFFAWACTFALHASPEAAAGVTLEDLMREALAHNHDLAAARAQVDAAFGRLTQAGLWPNPRLELSNETDALFNNDGQYTRSVGVTQEFPIAGRLARAQALARVDVARALAEVNEAERQLLGEITTAFYEVVTLDQRISLRERLIRVDESLVTDTTDRQKAGEVSELDVNTATLELERLRQERMALSGARATALRTLAGTVGYSADATPAIDSTPPSVKAPQPLADLMGQALDRRTDLRLLALAADRAQAELLLARASVWEDWSVSLGVRQDKLVIVGAPPQPADKALMLTLAVPLPLRNRNQGSRAAAVAEATRAREQLIALRVRIENDIAGRHEQVSRLLTALNSYTDRTLPLSRRNTDVARDAYRHGQLSIVDVVQAERQENDLNTGYVDTFAQYLRALAELNTSTVAYAPLMSHPVERSTGRSGER